MVIYYDSNYNFNFNYRCKIESENFVLNKIKTCFIFKKFPIYFLNNFSIIPCDVFKQKILVNKKLSIFNGFKLKKNQKEIL
jgi:hypothetical protein